LRRRQGQVGASEDGTAAWLDARKFNPAAAFARLASPGAFPYRLAARAVFPTPLEAKGALFF
jgi:hypothetical protein